MKRKVTAAFLKDPSGHPLSGETTLNSERHPNIEMWTGLEPGFLTVFHMQKEVGIPLSNVKNVVWSGTDKQ